MNKQELTFRPLSRQIGSYTKNQWNQKLKNQRSFRPLSRQIGSYTHILWLDLKTNTRYNLFGN